jgi:CheY-like chemotaxis protein
MKCKVLLHEEDVLASAKDELSVLIVEDNADDARFITRTLSKLSDMAPLHAASMGEALELAKTHRIDCALVDLSLPDCAGMSTIKAFMEGCKAPVVVLTGLNDEELGLKALRAGAQDYLVKNPAMPPQLLRKTIRFAIERNGLIEDLRMALSKIRHLEGIIPICSRCHSIQDKEGYWASVERYVEDHSDARFSHGICEKCRDETRDTITLNVSKIRHRLRARR